MTAHIVWTLVYLVSLGVVGMLYLFQGWELIGLAIGLIIDARLHLPLPTP